MTPAEATRQRLLDVAGPLFAEHGYRDATVQQICTAAGANVAAVNYHFGSKLEFYAAVLAHAHRQAFAGQAMPVATPLGDPRTEFAAWLRWWLSSMLDPERPTWLQTLIAREMVDPTPALDAMVERSIRPMHARLSALVARLLPGGTRPTARRDCVSSVIGQVLVYKHARPVLERLGVFPDCRPAGLQRLADHVAAFSLGGIDAMAGRAGGRARLGTSARRRR